MCSAIAFQMSLRSARKNNGYKSIRSGLVASIVDLEAMPRLWNSITFLLGRLPMSRALLNTVGVAFREKSSYAKWYVQIATAFALLTVVKARVAQR